MIPIHRDQPTQIRAKGNWTGIPSPSRTYPEMMGKAQQPYRSDAGMIAKQAVHLIANAIAKVVADFPHTVQPADEGRAVSCS
jgi:hypothetical protein